MKSPARFALCLALVACTKAKEEAKPSIANLPVVSGVSLVAGGLAVSGSNLSGVTGLVISRLGTTAT